MSIKPSTIGLVAAIISIILWFILNFFNPYSNQASNDTTFITLFMLVLPAFAAIFSYYRSKTIFMLIAFIWSLPLSLYLLMTPGIFLLFGITSFTYLISFILMRKSVRIE
ncbi:hypothetical protein V7182_00135 [Neobacillus drentensis]|uniref:hypothetical protein n=1 Tax=Neobacillus drentensis TaxID=220684 RepID=UPI002FFE80CA